MAKKKKREKIIRRRKKQTKYINWYRFGVLVFLMLAIAFIIFVPSKKTVSKYVKIDKNISLSKKAENKNIITPYPTVSPKPTQEVLLGYCLRVPVLMYHHIQPESIARDKGQTALTVDNGIFETQMQYLASSGYTTFFANEFINALITHSQLPAKSVVITMDDGYADNFIYALPILQKYNLKANLMLSTGLMGNADMLSWDQVKGLKSSGIVYFTNHTWSHYPISKPPQEKIETEIDVAQNEIQQETGQNVNVFTYPYGTFNDNAIQTLEKKSYIGAFSEIPGQTQCDSFLMTLHRTRIGNGSLASYGL